MNENELIDELVDQAFEDIDGDDEHEFNARIGELLANLNNY